MNEQLSLFDEGKSKAEKPVEKKEVESSDELLQRVRFSNRKVEIRISGKDAAIPCGDRE